MVNSTALKHPTFIKRIRRALWLAQLSSLKSGKRSTEYVQNRNKRNCLRLDVSQGKLIAAYASGCSSKNFSAVINKALEV